MKIIKVYLFLECLFALKDYTNADKLLKKHKDDWGIYFVYGRLLFAIMND